MSIKVGTTEQENASLLNLIELAHGGDEEAIRLLRAYTGEEIKTAGDLWRISMAVMRAMSRTQRETDMNNTKRRLGQSVRLKPDCVSVMTRKRIEAGMTQAQVAKLAGLSTSTISHLEQGITEVGKMRLESALKLAQVYGVSVDELVGFNASEE